MAPLLRSLLNGTGRRVLVAGAADTGVPAFVLNAYPQAELTVVDRCATPVELCRRFGQRAGVGLTARQGDLATLRLPEPVDLVLAHGLIGFVPQAEQARVIAGLAGAMAPGGSLLLDLPVSKNDGETKAAKTEARWQRVRDGLAARAIPLPEPPGEFRDLLLAESDRREDRDRATPLPDEIRALMSGAGLALQRSVELAPAAAGKPHRRRTILVARRD